MEYEVRFYYPKEELNKLLENLQQEKSLNAGLRTYEKTIQFNHCDPRYDFYSKKIDGRFRLRVSVNAQIDKCKLSWKRRLSDTTDTSVNKEEEKEVEIKYSELDNFLFIIKNVMHFDTVESYERYRTTFTNDDIEIAVDEYPFGIAIEIENKSDTKNPEENVINWAQKLGFDLQKAYRLSWDDKYLELCEEQNVPRYNEVTFDKEMPRVR